MQSVRAVKVSSIVEDGVTNWAIAHPQTGSECWLKDTLGLSRSESKTCVVLVLTALPFSTFSLCVAVGQSGIINFFVWNAIACLLTGFPFLVFVLERQLGQSHADEEPCAEWKADLNEQRSEWAELSLPPLGDRLQGFSDPEAAIASPAELSTATAQHFLWKGWRTHHTSCTAAESSVPIILVHGFGGSVGHWRHNLPELGRYHRVYAIDLLGFGASEKPDIAYSLDLWVEQVYDYWKTFVKVPAVLVGNSLGSLTCLAIAAAHPEMVRGVAMISLPDARVQEENHSPVLRFVLERLGAISASPLLLQPLFYLVRQPWVVKHWASFAYACRESVTDELLEILLAPARDQGSARAFCAIFKAMLSLRFSLNVRAVLSKLRIPSLLVWGRQDRMVPIALAHRFLSYNPALQLIELENAGHCAHDERPEQVNWELLNWIQTAVLSAGRGEAIAEPA